MKIYLAGGISGNLNPLWRDIAKNMKIYLAGNNGRWDIIENFLKNKKGEAKTKVYLARTIHYHNEGLFDFDIQKNKPYILESFYYADEHTVRLLKYFGDFLLDSGAFTFMQNQKESVDWDNYIERYADFINKNKITKFFELDIDKIVGYDKVLEYRKKLEKLTNNQPIPVWHVSRGYEEFLKMCDEYKYVAIGGIVAKEIKKDKFYIFSKLIKEAHKRGCKIHGLGFTNLQGIKKYHFDSVDSTAWTTGNRFGFIYKFNGKTMIKKKAPKNNRIINPRKAALINFTEWIKFQKYADKHL